MILWPFRQPAAEPMTLQTEAAGAAAGTGSLAPRVVSARRRQGRTQTELALAIGWSERNLRRLEKGELPWVRAIENGAHPTARERAQLRALARELRTDLDELLPSADVVPGAARIRVAGAACPGGAPRPMLARTGRPRRAGTASAAMVGTAAVLGAGHLLTATPPPPSDRFAPPLTARSIPPALMAPGGPAAAPPAPASPSAAAQPPVASAATSGAGAGAGGGVAPDPELAAVDVSHHPVGPIASLSTSTVDFGWVSVGSNASRTVTLTNLGDGPLHVSRTTLLGSSEVSATEDTCAGRTLAPHHQCSVTLVYAPHRSGMLAPFAQLGFVDDAPGVGGGQAVTLAGATGA